MCVLGVTHFFSMLPSSQKQKRSSCLENFLSFLRLIGTLYLMVSLRGTETPQQLPTNTHKTARMLVCIVSDHITSEVVLRVRSPPCGDTGCAALCSSTTTRTEWVESPEQWVFGRLGVCRTAAKETIDFLMKGWKDVPAKKKYEMQLCQEGSRCGRGWVT